VTGDISRSGAFRLGDWLVQPDLGRISHGEEVVHLRPQLMDLLVFLAQRAGELASKQEILDEVWPEEFVAESALTRCIAELRQALGDEAAQPRYIETVPKRGYRLIAAVTPAEPEASPPTELRARGFRPRWSHALAVTIAAVIALLVVLPPEGIWQRITTQEPPAPERLPRIVVLPFKNLGLPEDEDFVDGMTSELISRLSVVSGLEVISTTSSMYYKGAVKKLSEIGDELGADYALEGEVRWERPGAGPDRVRITPQLIRVADDTHVWSDLYDRDIERIFEVQSDIAHQVVANIHVTLLEPEQRAIEARPTDNMDAYTAYLRGLDNVEGPGTDEGKLAIAMFERAVELDPEFALAYAALSHRHMDVYARRGDLDPERMALAKRAADRALELDPDLPEAHHALAAFYAVSGESERAVAEFRQALALRPNDVTELMAMSEVQWRRGQWQEAVDLKKRALELDPRNDRILGNLARTFWLLRRYPEAAEINDRAIAIAPDKYGHYLIKVMIYWSWHGPSRAKEVAEDVVEVFPRMQDRWCVFEMEVRNWEAALVCFDRASWETAASPTVYIPSAHFESVCYARMGEHDLARRKLEEALDQLESAVAVRPEDPAIHSSLGLVYARLGRKEDAIREGERAVALQPVSAVGTVHQRHLAGIYMTVGEPDAALDTIEYLLSIPGELSVAWLDGSTWDPLRDHPRFQEILEKYGDEQ
jgi:serine/threonine-protein kinase